jgi:SRSO17 transposase
MRETTDAPRAIRAYRGRFFIRWFSTFSVKPTAATMKYSREFESAGPVPSDAAGFVTGLLADLEIKTCWQVAEQAGHARPDAMQRLLYRAKWDADAVRDHVRKVVADRLGDPDGVLVVDETGDLKKGVHSVGVQRQYTGTAERIENAQVGVFPCLCEQTRSRTDRPADLPTEVLDRGRCEQAGVPDKIAFATRSELADDMITAAVKTLVPAQGPGKVGTMSDLSGLE